MKTVKEIENEIKASYKCYSNPKDKDYVDGVCIEKYLAAVGYLLGKTEKIETVVRDIPFEELETLCDAWRDGRVVVLPLKLKDKVYYKSWDGIQSGTISGLQQKANGDWKIRITNDKHRYVFDEYLENFGYTYFSTPEQAEALVVSKTEIATKGMEGK